MNDADVVGAQSASLRRDDVRDSQRDPSALEDRSREARGAGGKLHVRSGQRENIGPSGERPGDTERKPIRVHEVGSRSGSAGSASQRTE
jgi:hypothetical protein